MIRQRPTVDAGEIGICVYKNISGSDLTKGMSVYFAAHGDTGANLPDSAQVALTSSATRLISLWAGIVFDDTILDQRYGRFQTLGPCNFALIHQDAAATIAVGEFLTGVSGQSYLGRLNPQSYSRIVCMESVGPGSSTAGRRVHILAGS